MTITLNVQERLAVPHGAVELRSVSAFRGQQAVATFHAWIYERYRELDLRRGDVARAGDVAFSLRDIDIAASRATIAVEELHFVERGATLGSPFAVQLGQDLPLPGGRSFMLTAITRYGLEAYFLDSNQCRNFTAFDFGFLREDGLLFEVLATDAARGVAHLLVNEEGDVARRIEARFGELAQLGPRDVACYPDGTTVLLRSARRQSYDAVNWRIYARNGADECYPFAGSVSTDGVPEPDQDRGFGLLSRQYALTTLGMTLTPSVSLSVTVHKSDLDSFRLGESFVLAAFGSRHGPDGVVVQFVGTAHGHGTTMGANGELVPVTDAWAEFAVVRGGMTTGFQVDLLAEDDSRHDRFGFRFEVLHVSDDFAELRVTRPSGEFDLREDIADVDWAEDDLDIDDT